MLGNIIIPTDSIYISLARGWNVVVPNLMKVKNCKLPDI